MLQMWAVLCVGCESLRTYKSFTIQVQRSENETTRPKTSITSWDGIQTNQQSQPASGLFVFRAQCIIYYKPRRCRQTKRAIRKECPPLWYFTDELLMNACRCVCVYAWCTNLLYIGTVPLPDTENEWTISQSMTTMLHYILLFNTFLIAHNIVNTRKYYNISIHTMFASIVDIF